MKQESKMFRAWAENPQTGLSTYVDVKNIQDVKFDNDGNTNEPLIADPNPADFEVIEGEFKDYQVQEIMYEIKD